MKGIMRSSPQIIITTSYLLNCIESGATLVSLIRFTIPIVNKKAPINSNTNKYIGILNGLFSDIRD